ncbi:MAG: NAD-dependent succinate-semialdehyde dehydrogenase [Gemmatimonadetes bacterium]|nr:NAD-dependent succinate-semialdehyde dehydrogenase [Gemmatimonadota bacterium]
MLQSVNPASGEVLETFQTISDVGIDERLGRAWAAFLAHRATSFAERADRLVRAAEILEREKGALGRIMTLEMGKPIGAAVAEAEKCASACRYYAEHGERFLADEEVKSSAVRSFIRYQPLGPVLAVMPWNFPFWQVFRFAAPALLAGNVAVLKHASNVPRCALTIEDIFRRAGFGEGVFQTLLAETEQVAGIIDDPRIRAVTLTGSTRAGSAVAERAGKRIKKAVLELGGNDPFIVLPSADVAAAATTAVRARTLNNGQSCIAAKRFIVHEAVYADFERRFVAGMEALRIGDPLDPVTEIGPLATPDILQSVEDQVRRSVEMGARVLTGGTRARPGGNWYAPTVLTDIPPESPAYREEIFGPVASLFRVPDLAEAIRLANDTPFGLGSSAWTNDAREQSVLVEGIEAGQVFVNGMVASDPRLPFGGVKESGYGRELAAFGIREFVNVKTIWMGGEGPDGASAE